MANMWRSTIQWLGLGSDEEYDDYDPEGEPVPSAGSSRHPRPEPEPPAPVRPLTREPEPVPAPAPPPPAPAVAEARPRNGVVRHLAPAPPSAKPHAVSPTSFNQAQEVADKFMAGVPVIMNLQGAEKDLSRRLVDFASGLCYGLSGQMERVTNQVYLLTPSDAEVSEETRRRLQDSGS